jgi:hypothetical protein
MCVTIHSSAQEGHVRVRHVCVTVHSSTHNGHVWVRYTMLKIPTGVVRSSQSKDRQYNGQE